MIVREKLVEKLLLLNMKKEAVYIKKLKEEEYVALTKEMVAYAMEKEKSKKVVMEEVGVGLDALSDKYTRADVMSAVASLTSWRSGPTALTIALPAGLVMNLASG